MPAKGSVQRYGNRDYVFGKKFYETRLVEKHNVQQSYNDCKNIIKHANLLIADIIEKEIDGFKLPFGMGYLCACKYVPSKPAINWSATNELGKYVFHTNMHTDGYACRITWFRVGRVDNTHYHEIYKFKAVQDLSRSVSENFKNGYPYNQWTVSDFIEKGRLENLYNKRYRPELKN
jgi:hypothetical protein